MKILFKNSVMTNDVQFKIAHSLKNCINLDQTDGYKSQARFLDEDLLDTARSNGGLLNNEGRKQNGLFGNGIPTADSSH